MTRESDDLHERFVSWLLAGDDHDPPRDVAFHAALCAECGRWIAAQDALSGIDPGRAPLPPSRAVTQTGSSGWQAAGRLAAATGALAVIGGVVALGAVRFLSDLPEGQAQQVLAATGSPEATPRMPTRIGGQVTAAPSPSARGNVPTPPTAHPSAAPTHRKTASPRPTAATRTPTPPAVSVTPVATATPASATATPSASPTPTEVPTPTPTVAAS